MALLTVKRRVELGRKCVLAPERYDPRRDSLRASPLTDLTVPLASIVRSVRQTISPVRGKAEERQYIVLDTSDVREGFIIGRKRPVRLAEFGSAKKLLKENDVLISRLRPYLRQVALVDVGFCNLDADLACSTEFFVLRSLDEESIGFLVPYLLSAPVQSVLAASQEGGHHPRFDEDSLMTLPVPRALLARRSKASAAIVRSAALYRQSERTLQELIGGAEAAMVAQRDGSMPG
jgi:hypothetical protein